MADPKRTVLVTVTYLEMRSPDRRPPAPEWPEPTRIMRAERPAVSFYRYLYDTVGAHWGWYERRRLSDEALAAIVHDDAVEVFVLYVRGVPAQWHSVSGSNASIRSCGAVRVHQESTGCAAPHQAGSPVSGLTERHWVPAGYVELDRRVEGEVEIAYFGLVPDCIGRGLGSALLDWALERAWSDRPCRVWLHTCSLDHPKALAVYRRAGFEVYDHEVVAVEAELLGLARQGRRERDVSLPSAQ